MKKGSCYYVIFFNMSLFVIRLIDLFSYLISLRFREQITSQWTDSKISPKKTSIVRTKKSNTRTDSNISPKKLPLLEEKSPTPQHLSKLVNNTKTLNLNIAAYFLNVLGYPDESTWSTKGGPINKTIEHLRLSRHHQKTINIIWLMVSKCKQMKTDYTGNNYNLQGISIHLTLYQMLMK